MSIQYRNIFTNLFPIINVLKAWFCFRDWSLVFIFPLIFLPAVSWSAIKNAVSCSYSDVSAAYNMASSGDTVIIPAGTCTWANTLTLAKAITLQGAGKASTILTQSGSTTLIDISPSSDIAIRVTGIAFVLGGETGAYKTAIGISGSRDNSYKLTKIRIDNSKFTKGNQAIFASGTAYGSIDHNEFVNGSTPIFLRGSDDYDWLRPYGAGTADALFIEDNTFTITNDVDTTNRDAVIYIQEGYSSVVRYNTFDSTQFTTVNYMTMILNNHGNQNYYVPGSANFRGQPIFEMYNNVARAYKTDEFASFRGDSVLIHDNSFTTVTGSPTIIQFSEEEAWQSQFFSPLRTTWPAEDQMNNSFIWNNTYNGSPVLDISLDDPAAANAIFIQKNRDYFMHPPQATGGKETWPDRPGSSNMIFSSSGANAYYPYTPYTYPHPLTGLVATLMAPLNLRITQ
ncbi:MAG: hypothetical protein ACXWRA_14950 [Pseudobdellovibrionaceae bacterium]